MADHQYLPRNPPKPANTKRAAKRKKMSKSGGIRKPSTIGLIYRTGTDCQVADEATEARLGRLNSWRTRGLREDSVLS